MELESRLFYFEILFVFLRAYYRVNTQGCVGSAQKLKAPCVMSRPPPPTHIDLLGFIMLLMPMSCWVEHRDPREAGNEVNPASPQHENKPSLCVSVRSGFCCAHHLVHNISAFKSGLV